MRVKKFVYVSLLFTGLYVPLISGRAQESSPSALADLNREITHLMKSLAPEGNIVYTTENRDHSEKLEAEVSFSDCRLIIHSSIAVKSEDGSFLKDHSGNGIIISMAAEGFSPKEFKDEQWGRGIALDNDKMKNIYFSSSAQRNSVLGKLQKLKSRCAKKEKWLKDFAHKQIQKDQTSGEIRSCDHRELIWPGFLGETEKEFINDFIEESQKEKLDEFLKLYLKKFPNFTLTPEFAIESTKLLEILQANPSFINKIPLKTMGPIIRQMGRAIKEMEDGSEFPWPRQSLLKAFSRFLFDDKWEIFRYLTLQGKAIEDQINLIKFRKEVPLEELLSLLEKESAILDLDKYRWKEKGDETVAGLSRERVISLGKIAKEILSEDVWNKIFGVLPLATMIENAKKAGLQALLQDFDERFNFFHSSRLAGRMAGDHWTEDTQEDFELICLKVLDLLITEPHLIFSIREGTLMEFLKIAMLRAAERFDVYQKVLEFLQKNGESIFSFLSKMENEQNIQVYQHLKFKPEEKITAETFFRFAQKENDIIWNIIFREQEIKSQLQNMERKNDGELLSSQKREEDFQGKFKRLIQASRFRMALMLDLFQKHQPDAWSGEVANSRLEDEVRPDRDFEHYGRYGVAGDLLAEMIKYQGKLATLEEWKGKKRTYETLKKIVLSQVENYSDLPALMEFAEQISMDKTSALEELIRLNSEATR